ncbi:hypothetical protein DPIF89300162_160034 [Tenacibaculum maritimum]|nr:hypothetical protein DPIF89300162_160034 [Tenacibaculum maritimum]
MNNTISYSILLLVFIAFSCQKKECVRFQDMYKTLPKNLNLDTLFLKGKITCNYRINYTLTNEDESADLIVSMFDEDIYYRLKGILEKMPEKKGILYKTKNFCKTVRSIVKGSENLDEHTSFEQTSYYKAGFTTNRVDAIIKNRYCLTIFLHTAKKIEHQDFKNFIQSYLHSFNFTHLKD